MGTNRGKRNDKRGKLAWKNRKANRGRRPGIGKRPHFFTWSEVRAKMQRNQTKVVKPEAAEAEAETATE